MKATVYLHSSKDNMGDKAQQLNLSENASGQFRYALSEVKFDLEVNEETGQVEILAVDGRKLMPLEDVYPDVGQEPLPFAGNNYPEPFGDN